MAKPHHPWTEPIDDDDAHFLAVVDRLVEGLAMDDVAAIRLVRIDNWFGPKWLGFAGKTLGALGVHQNTNRSDLVVPPFTPGRLVRECHFAGSEGRYSRVASSPRLHRTQTSAANLHRKLATFSPHAHFIWFSGNSQPNARGSVLVASIQDADQDAFYLGFTRKSEAWRIGKVVGNPPFPVEDLLGSACV